MTTGSLKVREITELAVFDTAGPMGRRQLGGRPRGLAGMTPLAAVLDADGRRRERVPATPCPYLPLHEPLGSL